MGIEFEGDPSRAALNKTNHGVDFGEAEEVFSDPLSLTIPDPVHSLGEEHFVTIGQTLHGELLVVVHKDQGETVRIISARRATAKERKAYEQNPA